MAGHVLKKKVTINDDTARYYLILEQAFVKIWDSLKEDPINRLILAKDPQLKLILDMDTNLRYMYRSDLHDNWSKTINGTPRNGLF